MNKNVKKAQAGFTLIELIVVIAILGILAATALPKFVDVSSDARVAAVQGVAGSMSSASGLAHAQALLKGQTGATGSITLEGNAINLVYGYPAAGDIGTAAGVTGFTAGTVTSGVVTFSQSGAPSGCNVSYKEATSSLPPVVTPNVTC